MNSKYTEQDLQNAIRAINNGMSQSEAARRWGIPRPTLVGRLKGRSARKEAFKSLQRLSSVQERHLAGWILTQDTIGLAPTHNQIRELAAKVASSNGDLRPIGKNWLEGFLHRNPEVKTLRGILPPSGPTRDPPKTPLQSGRDRACNRPERERISDGVSGEETGSKEAVWAALLEHNYRVYLSSRDEAITTGDLPRE